MKGKEVKIGLSIVAVLLTIFGFLLYRKIQSPATVPKRPEGVKTAEAETPQPKLSSGPTTPPPKVVQPASGVTKPPETSATSQAAASGTTRTWNPPASTPPNPTALAPVQPARLPLGEDQSAKPTQSVDDFASPDRYSRRYASRDASSDDAAASASEDEATSEAAPPSPRVDRYAGSRYGDFVQEAPTYADSNTEWEDGADDASDDAIPDAPSVRERSSVSDPFERRERVTIAAEREPASPFAERNVLRESPQPSPQPQGTSASRYSDAQAYDIYGRNAPRAEPPRAVRSSQPPAYPSPPAVEQPPRDELTARPAPPPDREALVDDGDRYMVRPNDNFWEIAKRLYGDGGYFKALFEHNRAEYPRPDLLRPGDMIAAPSAAALAQTYPDLVPKPRPQTPRALTQTVSGRATLIGSGGGRTYTVEEGDTLFDIARHELGTATRWVELYELNREAIGGDIDYLRPGTQLVLPGSERPDHIATRPGESSRR